MIELRTVTKTYIGAGGGFTALNHIDLESWPILQPMPIYLAVAC